MKKFKERMAEKAGFTLVELIVVIAILGILAAVAVPAYSGYVKKADTASDLMQLDAVKTAVTAVATEQGDAVAAIEVSADGNTIKYTPFVTTGTATPVVVVGAGAVESSWVDYISGNKVKLTSDTFKNGAKWTPATESEDAKWAPLGADEEGNP